MAGAATLRRGVCRGLFAVGLLAVFSAGAARAGEAPGVEVAQAGRAAVDRVVVEKGRRMMFLMRAGEVVRTYRIALGRDPLGPKRRKGDGRTPEGRYMVDWRNPQSRFHRSLHISYPNAADRARASRAGGDPGGDIMIHGLPNGRASAVGADHVKWDWTEGCIAVTNREIDEIWRLVDDHTPIDIRP